MIIKMVQQFLDWNNLFKIKIRELTDAQTKHLIVKTLIVRNLLMRYKKDKKYLRIYTEFPVSEGKICDIYFENFKTKEAYAYEIQDKITSKWLKDTTKFYKDWDVSNCNTSDLIVVDLKKLSNNITELNKEIKEIIV